MALVPVDLPTPESLRGRWAAHAAVMAAVGYPDSSRAESGLWHYDDGGGNWCDLILLDGGRAVLQGHDHEYSETYFRHAASYFGEPETDLLAGAPEWWGAHVPTGEGHWVGFIYGYDGSWQRADYDLDDGFESLNLPALSEPELLDSLTEFITQYAEDQLSTDDHSPTRESLLALAAAGPALTAEHLSAVFGPVPGNFAAGVSAARAFA